MRVPGNTSPKIRKCMENEKSNSKATFESCLKKVVEDAGGKASDVWFEQNGTYAHALVEWETLDQKAAIVFDIEADEVIDVMSPADLDKLAHERRSAT
jgi:hypothetical protein